MAKIDRNDVERTPWAAGAMRLALFESAEFGVTEQNMPAGTIEPRHLHRRAGQYMLVIDGAARLEVDGAWTELLPGDAFFIRPGLAHHVETKGAQTLRLLVVSQPSAQGDRVEME